MRLCQLQKILEGLFLLTFFLACSTPKVKMLHEEKTIEASWQKAPQRFAHREYNFRKLDREEIIVTHPFFDIAPGINVEHRLINMFTTIPEDSFFKYNFDLYSGMLYKDHDYCPTSDIWKNYSGDLIQPNFIQGIVPRVYDERQLPQKIILFSDKNQKENFKLLPTTYNTVRIIGSIVIDVCDKYPCDLPSKWSPSQILVAVDPFSIAYSNVQTLSEVKKKVNWKYVESILVNQDGVHQLGSHYFPANRLSREFNLDETYSYFKKNSKQVNMEDLESFRGKCFKLYDEIWEKSESIRQGKTKQQQAFFNYFKEFYEKSSGQFYQCQKLFRPASINDNDKRLWFFTFLQAFTNLEKNGFYYNCSNNAWNYNSQIDEGHYLIDQNKELTKCHAGKFEKAFDLSINALALMKNQVDKGYRFIEYDTQHGGSHQKIYGWIEDKKKVYICNNSNNDNLIDFFPQDVVWSGFLPDNDVIIH